MSMQNSGGVESSDTRGTPEVVEQADVNNPLSFLASERLGHILGRIERGEATDQDLIKAIHLSSELDELLDEVAAEWANE